MISEKFYFKGLRYLLNCVQIKSIFNYTSITLKRVTSLLGPFMRLCAQATQLLLPKKCCRGGESLATLSSIRMARDLSLTPPAPEASALPLDKQAVSFNCVANFNFILSRIMFKVSFTTDLKAVEYKALA